MVSSKRITRANPYTPRRNAWDFFRANAGGIVGQCATSALQLARAEEKAQERELAGEWRYTWQPDDYADTSWMDKRDLDLLQRDLAGFDCCTLEELCPTCGQWRVIASLGGIHWINRGAADRKRIMDYQRVIQAELACEALHEQGVAL